MTLNLRHLRLFLAVAEDLHFSRAAARMGIAEPAMSRAIRSLEGQLGGPMFHRNSRNVELTPAGRLLQIEGQAALDQLNQAIRSVRAAAQGDLGLLRIGYMDFALAGGFPRVLKEYRGRYPDVSVIASASFTERIVADVRAGRFEVGFVVGPVEDPALDWLTVQKDGFVAVLPDSHRLASKKTVGLTDLVDEPLILGRRETWAPYVRRVESLCRTAGFNPNVVQEADSADGLFAFVAAGMGSTIYVQRAFTHTPPGLVVRPIRSVSDTVTSELIWRRHENNPIVTNFIDLSKNLF